MVKETRAMIARPFDSNRLAPLVVTGSLVLGALFIVGAADSAAAQALFQSQRITPKNEYTGGIEGPASDAAGTLYVVNFKKAGTIGKLPLGATQSELFIELPKANPKDSIGNGIRFDSAGRMYVADFNNHNVFVFDPVKKKLSVYFSSKDKFHQPNDLAIAADGTLYASDPDFRIGKKTGQIWRIKPGPATPDGDPTGIGELMSINRPPQGPKVGTTNGIDLSPDGQTLYVSESNTRQVWAYRLDGLTLTATQPIKKFDGPPGSELDGLRVDVDGKIYVTRPGNGTVAVITPDGNPVREISLQGKSPSNLTFGGADGRTVFVTQVDGGFIEAFRVDRPGREPCMQFAGAFC
jgi:sugar lactone lactonase YvrE